MFLISHDYHSTVHKIFYNKMCHNLKKIIMTLENYLKITLTIKCVVTCLPEYLLSNESICFINDYINFLWLL